MQELNMGFRKKKKGRKRGNDRHGFLISIKTRGKVSE